MEFPRGGLIGKTVHRIRGIQQLRVPLYAANACYFLVLSVFPALLLLLGLLRYTNLEVERLAEMLHLLLPEALWEGAEELILLTYDNTSGTVVGVSAVAALWSASRGIFGVLTGLNAVYGVTESRGYVYTRTISVVYTIAFVLILILTLMLHIFGTEILELLERSAHPPVKLLVRLIDFRSALLVALQTVFFAVMFMALPNRRNGFRESIPGAAMASVGWLVFSRLYSFYVEHFATFSNVYGSVYAISFCMLWLYCCMSIVFYGAVVNVLLSDGKQAG